MKRKILALLGGTFLSGMAMAGGYQVNLAGQRQIGMGHAGTGLAMDNASIFFNPGAMSHIREHGITIGASGILAKIAYRAPSPSNSTAMTDNPLGTPFQVYGTYGVTDKLSVGLGVYTPFGSTVNWGNDWNGRFGLTQLSLQAIFVQPTASYQINEKVGIGFGLVYAFGGVNLQRDIPLQDQQGNYGTAELDGKANGIGFNAGLYLKPSDRVSLGLSYRSKVDMKVDGGSANFTVASAVQSRFPNTNFAATLPLPSTVTLGVGFTPTEDLTLALDVSRVGWSAYKSLRFDYDAEVNGASFLEADRNYKDSYIYRIGAEYKATDMLALRAGIYYDESPVQEGYLTPETPDADALGLSVGVGYRFSDKISLDASFLYVNRQKRTDTGELAGGIAGTYKAVAYIPGIGVTYNF